MKNTTTICSVISLCLLTAPYSAQSRATSSADQAEGRQSVEQLQLENQGPSSLSSSPGNLDRASDLLEGTGRAALAVGRKPKSPADRIDCPHGPAVRGDSSHQRGERGHHQAHSQGQRGDRQEHRRPSGNSAQRNGAIKHDVAYDGPSDRLLDKQVQVQDEMSSKGARSQPQMIDDGADMSGARAYGPGFAGTVGLPSLSYFGDVAPGNTISLFAENSSGVETGGYLLAGYESVSHSMRSGGTILVSTDIMVKRIKLAPGTQAIAFTVPADALLQGSAIYTQVIIQDEGAAGGFAMTNGLKLFL